MKNLIPLMFASMMAGSSAYSQGCVAVRGNAGFSSEILFKDLQPTDRWLLNINNRYFEASSTIRGKDLITDSLVTNKIYTLNFSVTRLLNKGWSIGLVVPLSANSRNNGGDHKGPGTSPRYTTHSFGLGDMRIAVYKWILPYAISKKGNIQAGLGLKLPTGDYKYQDYFVRNDSTKVLAPVDQAIQLGDGGTGITAELNGFYRIADNIDLFGSFYYLANPREQNGVSNLKGRPPTTIEKINTSTEMSVPDQYSLRAGGNYELKKIVLTAAFRYERVPAYDLIGGNKGFRRAASVSSIEPGLAYKMKNTFIFTYFTFPIKRQTLQSYPDKLASDYTGNYIITQAGFADFILFAGVSFKL